MWIFLAIVLTAELNFSGSNPQEPNAIDVKQKLCNGTDYTDFVEVRGGKTDLSNPDKCKCVKDAFDRFDVCISVAEELSESHRCECAKKLGQEISFHGSYVPENATHNGYYALGCKVSEDIKARASEKCTKPCNATGFPGDDYDCSMREEVKSKTENDTSLSVLHAELTIVIPSKKKDDKIDSDDERERNYNP